MKYSPSMIPQLISRLEQAKSEQEVQEACQEVKSAVQARWGNESTRRKPMSEIRKAVRSRFPEKPTDDEKAQFPYYSTNSGKGRVNRWEHLAIKHLSEKEYNPQTDWSDVAAPVSPVVKPDIDILNEVGLSSDEVEAVKVAAKGADIREWVKSAIIQRANAINRKNEVLDEDLSEVPSEVLQNEKKYRSSPTASRELVSRAVRVVKRWNLDHPDQKWCVTNKILGQLTGVTVKAIAKTVEGMDLESYNQGQGLEPLVNRFTKAAVGNPSDVMCLDKVNGHDGTEVDYQPAFRGG